MTNLGSQNGHPGRPQIRCPPVVRYGIQWNSPLWNVSLDGPLDHLRAFHGIPWSQILRIAHSDLPKWVQNGHFWGPKWSILATFGIKLGPKLVILGSKMAHFGGPNSSEEPRNTHLVAFYPPNMPIWAIWALLAIWVGNGVFYPFSVHSDHLGSEYDCTTIYGIWSKLVISDAHLIPMMHITQYGGLDPSRDMVQGPQIWGARGPDSGPPPRGRICLYEAVWTL